MKENKVKFLDLSVTDEFERIALQKVFNRCLDHGQFVMGHEIENLERKLSEFVGRKFCISVSSGTDAIFLALKALGIGENHEIITTPLSWIATANAIVMTNAEPVFCDIKNDLNIDPDSIEQAITPRTKAILSVDYTGNLANYNKLEEIAKAHNLSLIQDGSQAFGATLNHKRCGNFGEISGISHNPMKIFGGLGEIGSIYTDDENVAEELKILRYNGTINKEFLKYKSLNFRADALQAAFLGVRLETISERLEKREKIANRYNEVLKDFCRIPTQTKNSKRVYYTYTIQTERRDELMGFLAEKGIETKIQHPLLMSQQKPYLGFKSYDKNAKEIVKNILCLPIHEKMSENSINYVIDNTVEFLK